MPNKQLPKGLRFIPSPKDLRDYKISKIYKSIQLPTEFTVRYSYIKDQGYVGSCVAHSISEILEANDNTNYSTGWIYGYRPQNYYQGEVLVIKTIGGRLKIYSNGVLMTSLS